LSLDLPRLAVQGVVGHGIPRTQVSDRLDVVVDDIGLHLLEGVGVHEDVEQTDKIRQSPVGQAGGAGHLDRPVLRCLGGEHYPVTPEKLDQVVGSHREQRWDVEVDPQLPQSLSQNASLLHVG